MNKMTILFCNILKDSSFWNMQNSDVKRWEINIVHFRLVIQYLSVDYDYNKYNNYCFIFELRQVIELLFFDDAFLARPSFEV